jgi:hypothetical protein
MYPERIKSEDISKNLEDEDADAAAIELTDSNHRNRISVIRK